MNEGFRSLPEDVQKKILGKAMGGVMDRPLFRQMGGPAQPMPQDMMQQPMMPPAEPTAQAEMQGQAVGEEVAARTMGNIDAATDVKSAIDALRGNAAPIEARYQELANFVGERDAAQTPESVLALTQPAIMMTEQGAMDSGIGELMQKVAGDTQMDQGMDQGLGGLMMQGAGNTPPQNFRQGGPVEVRHFREGTPPTGNRSVPKRAREMLPQFQPLFEEITGTAEERAAQLERDRQSARSDAMFNLANFGLAFAGETQGNTIAERLANAATRSNVVGGFQQAGKDVLAAKKAQEAQDLQTRTAALQTSIGQAQTEQAQEAASAQALAVAEAKKKPQKREFEDFYTVDKDGLPKLLGSVDLFSPDYAAKVRALANAAVADGQEFYNAKTIAPFIEKQALILKQGVTGEDTEFVTVQNAFTVTNPDGTSKTLSPGQNLYLTKSQLSKHRDKVQPYIDATELVTLYSIDGKDVKTFSKGAPKVQELIGSESWSTDGTAYRNAIQEEKELRILAETVKKRDNIVIRQNAQGQLVVFDTTQLAAGNTEPLATLGDPEVPDADYKIFSYVDESGTQQSVLSDLNSKSGKKLLEKVNNALENGRTGKLQNISTESVTPKGYLIPEKGVFTSYDGGKTYVDQEGVSQTVPGGAMPISDTVAYQINKTERMRASAIKALEEMDLSIIKNFEGTPEERALVKNAYESARTGTGFWSKVYAGIDAVVGGITGADLAIETQDARQFVRMIRVLGRSALAASPRYAVADLATTEQLFPNEQTLLANPETEARKLLLLRKEITFEKERILTKIASGDPIESSEMTRLNQKLFEIDRLNDLLGPAETIFANTSGDSFEAGKDILQKSLDAAKEKQKKTGPSGN